MKRISVDIFIRDEDLDLLLPLLEGLKSKALKEVNEFEVSKISYHTCGHDRGGSCSELVEVL